MQVVSPDKLLTIFHEAVLALHLAKIRIQSWHLTCFFHINNNKNWHVYFEQL